MRPRFASEKCRWLRLLFSVEMLRSPLVRSVPRIFHRKHQARTAALHVACPRCEKSAVPDCRSRPRLKVNPPTVRRLVPVSAPGNCENVCRNQGDATMSSAALNRPASGLAHGQTSASQQNQGRAVLYAHLRLGDAQIFRQQPLQRGPPVPAKRPQVWICAVQLVRAIPESKDRE